MLLRLMDFTSNRMKLKKALKKASPSVIIEETVTADSSVSLEATSTPTILKVSGSGALQALSCDHCDTGMRTTHVCRKEIKMAIE